MKAWVIINKRTKKFVTGFDYCYCPKRPISNDLYPPKMWTDEYVKRIANLEEIAKMERINTKYYKFVQVEINIKDNCKVRVDLKLKGIEEHTPPTQK